MTNDLFKQTVKNNIKPWNKDIMSVLSTKLLEGIEGYLDKIAISAMMSLNKGINLEYAGYKVLSPEEEFAVVSGVFGNRNANKKRMD